MSEKTRGSGHKLEYRQFYLNIRKNYFNEGGKCWNKLFREFVESPSMEMFKTSHNPEPPALFDSALSGRLGQG